MEDLSLISFFFLCHRQDLVLRPHFLTSGTLCQINTLPSPIFFGITSLSMSLIGSATSSFILFLREVDHVLLR